VTRQEYPCELPGEKKNQYQETVQHKPVSSPRATGSKGAYRSQTWMSRFAFGLKLMGKYCWAMYWITSSMSDLTHSSQTVEVPGRVAQGFKKLACFVSRFVTVLLIGSFGSRCILLRSLLTTLRFHGPSNSIVGDLIAAVCLLSIGSNPGPMVKRCAVFQRSQDAPMVLQYH
jgi:hypothetical protein